MTLQSSDRCRIDKEKVDRVVKTINELTTQVWPDGTSQPGAPIGEPYLVTINGDLTARAGGSDFFHMGDELSGLESHLEKLKPRLFVGLGNHDLSYNFKVPFKSAGRHIMWDYIRRQHRGYRDRQSGVLVAPVVPVSDIDAKIESRDVDILGIPTAPDYGHYSLDYLWNGPTLSILQLHRFGGDTKWHHASGLGWIAEMLHRKLPQGTATPLIVCQHFGADGFSIRDASDTSWSANQVHQLFNILRPYNLIAVMHGHEHVPMDPYTFPPYLESDTPISNVKVFVGPLSDVPPDWRPICQDLNEGAGGAYLYLCYQRNATAQPITDLISIVGDSPDIPAPAGYTKIDVDLNQGAGGKYIYFCYAAQPGQPPVTGLIVSSADHVDELPPVPGYDRDAHDLNMGAKGKFIYLYRRFQSSALIRGVTVLRDGETPPSGYVRIDQDLNAGTKSKVHIYLWYTTEGEGDPVTGLTAIAGDDPSIQPPPGWIKIPQDTNEGARGKYVYVCYTTAAGAPLTDVAVLASPDADHFPISPGFVRDEQDLKEGAGGYYIHLCSRSTRPLTVPFFCQGSVCSAAEYDPTNDGSNLGVARLRPSPDGNFILDVAMGGYRVGDPSFQFWPGKAYTTVVPGPAVAAGV